MALLLVSILGPGQEYLTVRIPETDVSYRREKQLERSRIAAFGLGFATMLYGVVFPGMFPALWLALGAVLVVAAIALHVTVQRQNVGISLDGSRRWVTLTGVHEKFVRAVQAEEAAGRIGARR